MNRNIFKTALVVMAFLTVAASAPAGPGDCGPTGPGPYIKFFCPATIWSNATSCVVWSYSYNMPCNVGTSIVTNGHMLPFLSYTETQCPSGTWVEQMTIDLTKLPRPWGSRLQWVDNAVDLCAYIGYTDTGTTTVLN